MRKPHSRKFDGNSPENSSGTLADTLQERRYAVRYAFAAAVEARDLETGVRCIGPLTDLSSSGCFMTTKKPLPVRSRVMLRITHGKETIEILATVRAIKHGSGMGLEFLDLETAHFSILQSWLTPLRD